MFFKVFKKVLICLSLFLVFGDEVIAKGRPCGRDRSSLMRSKSSAFKSKIKNKQVSKQPPTKSDATEMSPKSAPKPSILYHVSPQTSEQRSGMSPWTAGLLGYLLGSTHWNKVESKIPPKDNKQEEKVEEPRTDKDEKQSSK